MPGDQEEGEAAGKRRRAQMSAGQRSTCFVGVEETAALARDLRARDDGDPMRVHDAMLVRGPIAPRYLRRMMGLPPT